MFFGFFIMFMVMAIIQPMSILMSIENFSSNAQRGNYVVKQVIIIVCMLWSFIEWYRIIKIKT